MLARLHALAHDEENDVEHGLDMDGVFNALTILVFLIDAAT